MKEKLERLDLLMSKATLTGAEYEECTMLIKIIRADNLNRRLK